MAKFGSQGIKVEFDNSGGTLQNMSTYITSLNGFKINAETVDTTYLGSTWMSKAYAGVKSLDDVTIEGFYDDTATTGPDAIFSDVGNVATAGITRSLKITWDMPTAAKTTTVETIIKSYERAPVKGELTKYTVILECTDAVT